MYKATLSNIHKDEAIDLLMKVTKNSNYKYLAELKLASMYSNENLDKSLEIYSNLTKNNKLTSVLRQFAEYLKTSTLLKIGKVNKIDNLLMNKIYNYSNKEVVAIYKLKNNETKSAIDILKLIIDDYRSPLSIKKNARELLQIYSINKSLT